jgi:REP element-mobilizing transposase RayT
MSYIKIMVHVVWGTKNREPVLTSEKRRLLFDHIRSNAKTKGIHIDTLGGYTDHVHCLVSLGGDQTISKVVQLIKGESSFWANREKLLTPKLIWAEDYFAASVSESSIENVRNYINTQEEHHRKVTFTDEYEKFIKSYGFDLAKA